MQIRGEYKISDGLRKTAMIQKITIEGLKLFGKTLMKAKRKMIIKGILITVVGSVHPTLVLVIPATVDKLDELFEADNLLEGLGDTFNRFGIRKASPGIEPGTVLHPKQESYH